jgi:hypothetical protein
MNGMEMQFTLQPSGIGLEPGIVFDISRNIESKVWTTEAGVRLEVLPARRQFPAYLDTPNDDSSDLDENNNPNYRNFLPDDPNLPPFEDGTTNHIYVIDEVGTKGNTALADSLQFQLNANEFVRILVNGVAFANQNGLVEGSRASDFVSWHSRMSVIKDAATGLWKRDNSVVGENEIALGSKALGN